MQGRVGWAVRAAEGAGGSRCGPSPLAGAVGIAARCNATSSSSSSSAVSEAAGVHTLPRTEPVVSAEWLHANLKDPDVKVRVAFSSQCWTVVICALSCESLLVHTHGSNLQFVKSVSQS